MIKLLHAADFHLDSPFEGLSDEQAALRRRELRERLSAVFALAAEEEVDLILIAGDIFDGSNVYRESVTLLENLFNSCGVPVFIAPGNHDYWSPASPLISLKIPDNVHIFKTTKISRVELPEKDCVVYGAAFTSPVCAEPLLENFVADDNAACRVMVVHGDLQSKEARYNPVTAEDAGRSRLDYLALGHNHSFSGFRTAGGTLYACPGCPQGRGFHETGEKGVIIVELDEEKNARFVPLPGRRYESLSINLSGFEDPVDEIEEKLPKKGTKEDIYRLILTGQAVPEGISESELLAELGPRFHELSIVDRTRPFRNLWEAEGEDTLKGLFLSELKRRWDESGSEEERRRIELAARYGLAALENGEEPRIC